MASGARLRPARKWKLPTRQVFKNTGSVLDWLGTLNPFNLVPLAAMAMQNLDEWVPYGSYSLQHLRLTPLCCADKFQRFNDTENKQVIK